MLPEEREALNGIILALRGGYISNDEAIDELSKLANSNNDNAGNNNDNVLRTRSSPNASSANDQGKLSQSFIFQATPALYLLFECTYVAGNIDFQFRLNSQAYHWLILTEPSQSIESSINLNLSSDMIIHGLLRMQFVT